MSETPIKAYGSRVERLLAKLDFSWTRSQKCVAEIADHDAWFTRYRPGGPHALWIVGHLALVETRAIQRINPSKAGDLSEWKELFDQGTLAPEDSSIYPDPSVVQETWSGVRRLYRDTIDSLSESDLDRPIEHPRISFIRDVQSHIEMMIWHDAHHGAQLLAIAKAAHSGG